MRFRLYLDGTAQWRWQLFAANNRVIADSGEGYHNKADCRAAIELVQRSSEAEVFEDHG
jgi:uncharacterized protein YegP (UPF0339 family)